MSEVLKAGCEVAVNDNFLIGVRSHRITKFSEYLNFGALCPGYTARIAHLDTGVDITVIDQEMTRVLAA